MIIDITYVIISSTETPAPVKPTKSKILLCLSFLSLSIPEGTTIKAKF